MKRCKLSMVMAVLCLVPSASRAGIVAGYVPGDATSQATYNRFTSGYPSTTANPTTPISNTSPLFLGNGYTNNLSGVGWIDTNSTFSVTLVSERHFIGAAHVGYPAGTVINFVNAAGVVTQATVQTTRSPTTTFTDQTGTVRTLPSDVVLGTFTAPIAAAAGITSYGVLKAPVTLAPLTLVGGQLTGPPSPANLYDGQPLLNYGQNPDYSASTHLGRNTIDSIRVLSFGNYTTEATAAMVYDFDPAVPGSYYAIGGDSGSPSFIPYEGELTLVGGRYGVTRLTNTPTASDATADTFLPYYTDQLNAFMALDTDAAHPNGYELRVIPLPEPGLLFVAVVVVLRRRFLSAPVSG